MVGGNKDDGAYFGPLLPLLWGKFPLTGYDLDKLFEWMLPDGADRLKAKELYGVTSGFDKPKDSFRRFFRDSLFACTTHDMSVAWNKAGVPVHTYMMSFDYAEWGILKNWQAAHALELVFTWRNTVDLWGVMRLDVKQYKEMEDLMACTWASFVWCHEPRCRVDPNQCQKAMQILDWDEFDNTNKQYMRLDVNPSMQPMLKRAPFGSDEFPGEDRCDFWRTANMSLHSIRRQSVLDPSVSV